MSEDLDRKIAKMREEILSSTIEEARGKGETSEEKALALEGKVSFLEGTVASLKGQVAEFEEKASGLEGRVSFFSAELEKSKRQVSNLKKQIRNDQEKNNSLEEENEALRRKVVFLGKQAESYEKERTLRLRLEAEVKNLSAEIENLFISNSELKTKLEKARTSRPIPSSAQLPPPDPMVETLSKANRELSSKLEDSLRKIALLSAPKRKEKCPTCERVKEAIEALSNSKTNPGFRALLSEEKVREQSLDQLVEGILFLLSVKLDRLEQCLAQALGHK